MTAFSNLAAILLAAGFSRRMGGGNKLLKPLRGQPLIAHALTALAPLDLAQLIVVLGPAADAIEPLLPLSATIVRNVHAREGMGASLAAGAAALRPHLAGAFVVLADMPFVARGDYEKLAHVFAEGSEATICVPVHDGRRGHPVLFGAKHFAALSGLTGDTGARALLADPAAKVCETPGCSIGVLTDFDNPLSFAAHENSSSGDI